MAGLRQSTLGSESISLWYIQLYFSLFESTPVILTDGNKMAEAVLGLMPVDPIP